jgi:hypothetical protein
LALSNFHLFGPLKKPPRWQTFRWWRRGWNGGAEVAETTVKELLCYWQTGTWMMNWSGFGRNLPSPKYKSYTGISLEGLTKTTAEIRSEHWIKLSCYAVSFVDKRFREESLLLWVGASCQEEYVYLSRDSPVQTLPVILCGIGIPPWKCGIV